MNRIKLMISGNEFEITEEDGIAEIRSTDRPRHTRSRSIDAAIEVSAGKTVTLEIAVELA